MTLNIGVLGLGSVFAGPYSSLITRLAHEGHVRLVAGYDPDAVKRQAAVDCFGIDTAFATPADLVARDDLDIVLVLTSMNEHGALAKAALAAGKHVLVEKPAFPRLADYRTVQQARDRAGRVVLVGENDHYKPLAVRLRKLLAAGVIGDVVFFFDRKRLLPEEKLVAIEYRVGYRIGYQVGIKIRRRVCDCDRGLCCLCTHRRL